MKIDNSKIIDKLELPKDLFLGAMNISVVGKYEAYIENYVCIIQYTDSFLKLKGKDCNVKISGKNLRISNYTKDYMLVKGVIDEVSYY